MGQQRHGTDGGLTALAGFLYQTIGVLGLKVGIFPYTDDEQSDDLQTLISLAATGTLSYEHFDQDATIQHLIQGSGALGYQLIQFKYSRVHPANTIGSDDLFEIADRLKRSAARVLNHGQQVTGYVLLSNRRLTGPAQKELELARASQPSPNEKSKQFASILRELKIIEPTTLSLDRWEDMLRQFARSYGCLEQEVEQGINTCVGLVTRRAGASGSTQILKEDLIAAFTNNRHARQLLPTIVAQHCKTQLEELASRSHFERQQDQLVRRDALDELSELTQTSALVAITGSGGNGKTIALWHWMEECLGTSFLEQYGAYFALASAEDATDECFGEQLHFWAQLPPGHAWRAQHQPEIVLQRLYTARGAETRPIFILGLDAIDEALIARDRPKLKTLLRWFWNEGVRAQQEQRIPRATAIVTCRDAKRLMRDWLEVDSPFEGLIHDGIFAELSINLFSHQELFSAAQKSFPPHLVARIEEHIPQQPLLHSPGSAHLDTPSFSSSPRVLRPANHSSTPLDAQVLTSLSHPVLWRCLHTLNDPWRSQVLDGDKKALVHLGQKFLSWFCLKAQKRGMPLSISELEYIVQILVQRCSPHSPTHHMRVQWTQVVRDTGLMAELMANRFFEEALSAGLIHQGDQYRWYWGHACILQHLGASTYAEPS